MASTPASSSPTERSTRLDLGILTAVTIVLRLPAFFAERHLTFDDGVFGASAVAMRAGGVPFREVFSSQGPLFLPLLWVADLVGLRHLDSPRLLSVGAGVALVALVYLVGRTVADRPGALLAAGLTSGCASVLWVTGPLAADGVALAFATLTMLLLLRWRLDLTVPRAVWIGLALGAAISVKSLVGIVLIPVALALLAGRRLWPIVAGATTAVAFHLLLWLPWGPGDVWDQAYAYHLDVAGSRTPGANLAKTLSTLGDRDLPLVVVVLLALAAAAIAARRRARATASPTPEPATPAGQNRLARVAGWLQHPDVLLGTWLGATVLMLLTEHPMWRPHVAHLVPPLALLVARHRPPARALVAGLVLAVPYHVVHAWEVLHPAPFRDGSAEVVAALRSLPPGKLAISDDPGIVWRAGRRTTDDLVDTSVLRIETDRMDSDSVMAAASSSDVCAVAVRSEHRWGSFADLPDRLADAGYVVAQEDALGRRLYLKTACLDLFVEL
jgi:4-amino-4-deoxy-L-arabinose transferase-like glycosyltransferase